ncbi:MAG: type IV secretion system protein [Candidatus Eremiobacteraeota bacterium]|nr:type IV secretion system protein [Candidatus Eremiobacteraeota bacterium]
METTALDRRWAITMTRVALIAVAALVLALGAIIYLASQPKMVPIFFRENAAGELAPIGRVAGSQTPDVGAIRSQLADWIANTRTITSDPIAARTRQDRMAALVASGSPAAAFLAGYFKNNDPIALGRDRRVSVAINYVAPVPGSTREYEAEWTEDKRDPSGRAIGEPTRYRAHLSIAVSRPTDEATIYTNPIGLYITDLDWAQRMN